MSIVDINLRKLRVNFRKQGKEISDDVFGRFHPTTGNTEEICVFCKSRGKLTKEHVLPKWLFENDVESKFISSVNKQSQSYNKAVIPACPDCNNTILSEIEKNVIGVLHKVDENNQLNLNINIEDISNIIRWLEILDYKLQVYDCRRKYIKYGESEYNPLWGNMPASWMRHFIDMNPFKALDYLRRAQRRIMVKSKIDRFPSIVFFKTSTPHFNFFTQPDEYIYVSFPMHRLSVFYFLRKKFEESDEAYNEALYYIDGVFKT